MLAPKSAHVRDQNGEQLQMISVWLVFLILMINALITSHTRLFGKSGSFRCTEEYVLLQIVYVGKIVLPMIIS